MNIVKVKRSVNRTEVGIPAIIASHLPDDVTHMTVEYIDNAIVYRPLELAKPKGKP